MGRVQCLQCNAILESTSRHDLQICSCPNGTFVDGGYDYCRIGGRNFEKIKVIDDSTKAEDQDGYLNDLPKDS